MALRGRLLAAKHVLGSQADMAYARTQAAAVVDQLQREQISRTEEHMFCQQSSNRHRSGVCLSSTAINIDLGGVSKGLKTNEQL